MEQNAVENPVLCVWKNEGEGGELRWLLEKNKEKQDLLVKEVPTCLFLTWGSLESLHMNVYLYYFLHIYNDK